MTPLLLFRSFSTASERFLPTVDPVSSPSYFLRSSTVDPSSSRASWSWEALFGALELAVPSFEGEGQRRRRVQQLCYPLLTCK